MIKNVNTYNVGSLFYDLKDNEPNRNSNQPNCVPIMYQQKCNLYETKQGKM